MVSLHAPLFVPATRPDRFARAAASGTDAVILDLEDAVAADAKAMARDNLVFEMPQCRVVIRINAAQTPWHEQDLAALKGKAVAAVMLPKVERRADVLRIGQVLGTSLPVIALIETAAGLAAARRLARLPGVTQLAFGSVDFCVDVGCAHRRAALLSARSELVLASRLAGIAAPLDGVTTDLSDPGRAGKDARHARDIGMGGKMCIHPSQIGPVRMALQPTEAELDWARRVMASGGGVASVGGEMVDAPVRRRAAAILAALSPG